MRLRTYIIKQENFTISVTRTSSPPLVVGLGAEARHQSESRFMFFRDNDDWLSIKQDTQSLPVMAFAILDSTQISE